MQARLDEDVVPRAIGGKLIVSSVKPATRPWLKQTQRSDPVDPLSLASLACMTVAQAIRDLGFDRHHIDISRQSFVGRTTEHAVGNQPD